jgi:hypothetical protein
MKRVNYAALALACLAAFAACTKDNNSSEPDPNNPAKGRFVVAVSPIASTGVADYLLTASTLDSGKLSLAGNGLEQDGTYRYYTVSGTKFFSMLYGQGNPGAVTIYDLDAQGKLKKLSNFQSESVHAFGPVGNDILMVKAARTYTSPIGRWYQVGTENLIINKEGQFNALEFTNNGELAHFSWLQAVGNKVFAPYFSIKATTDGGWTTSYPDSAWIAVYSYPSMTLEKVIKDNRTSSIGLYFVNGLAVVENGDVYAFSPANTIGKTGTTQFFNSTKPSSITRIKAGTTEFDQTYLYDVETASGGYYINGWVHAGNGNMVVALNHKDQKSQWQTANRLAIVNPANKTFQWVTGLPDVATVSRFSMTNYSAGNGISYMGITTKDNKSAVYKINATTATATRGTEIDGGIITAIQWVPAK